MKQRSCSKCHRPYPISNFFWRNKTAGILHSQCKDCYRLKREETYAAYYDTHKAEYAHRAITKQVSNKKKLFEILSTTSCMDCGEADPVVLDFDHRDATEKRASIATMLNSNIWEDIQTEMKKCDVVCSNCHRRRTAKRSNSYRHRLMVK